MKVDMEELLNYNDGSIQDAYDHLKSCNKTDCRLCIKIHNYLESYQKMSDQIKALVQKAIADETKHK